MHVRRAVALALVVPLLLAGCSEDPEPTPQMPDPTSSSPTPEPTPTESETPEAESAEDFIRRWQAAADAMVLSGDSGEFLEMSEGCEPCKTYADQVADVYKQGGEVEFDGSEVVAVEEEAKKPPTYIVEVDARTLRILVPNEEPRAFPAATQRYRMTLGQERDGFTMRYYAVI